jgi:hypothetical protein
MSQSIHDSVTELREFVTVQASEDAVLSPSERRYQADIVKDVLGQAHLKPKVFKNLMNDYFGTLRAAAR